MSSTNRSAIRSPNDYYVTPVNAICHFLQEFHRDTGFNFRMVGILDPCAGGDASHPMSYPEALRIMCGDPKVETIDIREDSRAADKIDYLKCLVMWQPDVIISNPPFSIAQNFIAKALMDVRPGGFVIMLCRLTFFGSQNRLSWWKDRMPTFVYVHSKRMSFKTPLSEKLSGKPFKPGQSDSVEYAHFVWTQGSYPKWAQIRVI